MNDANLPSDPVISMARTKLRMGKKLTGSEQQYIQKYGKSDPWRPLDGPRHINLGRLKTGRQVSGQFMAISAEDYDRIFGKKKKAGRRGIRKG